MTNVLSIPVLRLFCDVIDTQSFSRAAEMNYLSQSAVSQRIQTLEREYGQTLIYRGQGRGAAVPTAAGQILYDGAKGLLRDAFALDARLREAPGAMVGTVRVATVYSVGLHALPPRLKPFLAAHPEVNVHLEYKRTDDVYQDVIADAIDVGIVACPTGRRGLDVVPFGEEEMTLICAPEHPLAKRADVSLRDLEGVAFVGFDSDIPTRKLIDRKLGATGTTVRLVATFDNIETIKSLVEIGNGVSILPADTVDHEIRDGALVTVPFIKADAFLRPTGILVKSGKADRAVIRAFVDAMAAPTA